MMTVVVVLVIVVVVVMVMMMVMLMVIVIALVAPYMYILSYIYRQCDTARVRQCCGCWRQMMMTMQAMLRFYCSRRQIV